MTNSGWITPFKKQCFVTLGVSINVAQFALVAGFTAILLPQLRSPGSIIPIDETSGSWIAAIPELALVFGNFTIPTIMAKYGRKVASIISITTMIIGWISIVSANSVSFLLVARFLQGLSLGMSSVLGPVMVGEYTSSNNRGAFLTAMSFILGLGAMIVHTVGSYVTWQATAVVCLIITFIDLVIAIYSPETPGWLADQGRYEACRVVFHWLRRDDEEDELNKMIEANEIIRELKANADVSLSLRRKFNRKFVYFWDVVRKREFYMPIFIMFHIYAIGNWAGINILSPYLLDIIDNIVGKEIFVPALVMSIDAQRIFSTAITVYVIKKVKRKTMLLATTGLCFIVLLSTALYVYAKTKDLLPVDHPAIGAVLIHLHMFTIASGSQPLPLIISGEIFPLEYRSISSGISTLFLTLHSFFATKTFPLLLRVLSLYGTYCLYAGIVGYSIMIAWLFLPETKDRTLQDIEDEFRCRLTSPEEVRSAQSLASWREGI